MEFLEFLMAAFIIGWSILIFSIGYKMGKDAGALEIAFEEERRKKEQES